MLQKESIAQRLARIRAERAAKLKSLSAPVPKASAAAENNQSSLPISATEHLLEAQAIHKSSVIKIPNEKQQEAIDLAFEGKTFCLCGAAGTGKTFTTQGLTEKLIHSERTKQFSFSTKYLQSGKPSIVLTAFTKRATKNAEEAINDPRITCVNFHKLLEYQPVFYEDFDEKGNLIKTMRFEPKYNINNKLPHISTILIEEASQFSVPMFDLLVEALPNPSATQFIFIGDIQQIPPTMGQSIYGPKLISEPGIELTEVYRQALESPIIRLLTDIRNGVSLTRNDWKKYIFNSDGNRNNKVRFGAFPPKLDWEEALIQAVTFLKDEFAANRYNPYTDMVLVPFNVKFGTVHLNKEIAHMLDRSEGRMVYPILAGWIKKFLAIGDYVLFNTEDFVIKAIEPNPKYNGISPDSPSKFIDREGSIWDRQAYLKEQQISSEYDLGLIEDGSAEGAGPSKALEDFVATQLAISSAEGKQDEKFNQASHLVKLQSLDDAEIELEISSTGDINKLLLSYAITIHKAQGLQAPNVYFFLHSSHSPMHFRELIYTAISRAQDRVTVICDPAFLERGIKNQRIPGVTLEEKKEYFKSLYGESL